MHFRYLIWIGMRVSRKASHAERNSFCQVLTRRKLLVPRFPDSFRDTWTRTAYVFGTPRNGVEGPILWSYWRKYMNLGMPKVGLRREKPPDRSQIVIFTVVFITSNYTGNSEIMQGCKDAGIPAFGTLWDFVSPFCYCNGDLRWGWKFCVVSSEYVCLSHICINARVITSTCSWEKFQNCYIPIQEKLRLLNPFHRLRATTEPRTTYRQPGFLYLSCQ